MERKTTMTSVEQAQQIMGENFIGRQQCEELYQAIRLAMAFPDPKIPYSAEQLMSFKDTHILILIQPLSILELRDYFGLDPDVQQPCFYNQDWYLNQDFVKYTESSHWCLLRKEVIDDTRSVQPSQLSLNLPSAQQCTFAFFAYYFATGGKKLWEYDFVWCRDTDHNGDRIYVGKYTDIDGVNKSGFSIHRHLALRKCYGAIEVI